MSTETTKVLARAAGTPLCDCVVVGIMPGGDVYLDHTGSTIASLMLYLELGKSEALKAWYEAQKAEAGGVAA